MLPRILMVNESSVLNTGYSVYGREVLTRLYNSGKYEVAELATYIRNNDERLSSVPWKVYTNLPDDSEREEYSKNVVNQFGAWKFEEVCLDFRPHIVFNIQDPWMFSYIQNSPYRKNFNFVIMPTVDSAPQSEQWLELFSSADGVFTYTDWSREVLNSQTNFKIKTIGTATPSVSKDFFPFSYQDKIAIKEKMGFKGKNIIGTVMRNQKRKLFPVLFKCFSEYLNRYQDKDTILYCHTSFPDMGWDIPKLLLEYGITSRVYFTYKCKSCENIYPSLFKDAVDYCPKCGNKTSSLVSVQNGADNKIFNYIYNLFDIYTQLAVCEGLGMPQLEAASCGIPLMSVDYSAMTSILDGIEGRRIELSSLQLEVESGAFKAVPSEESIINHWKEFFKQTTEEKQAESKRTRDNFIKNFPSWEDTTNSWCNHFDKVNIQEYENRWNSKPDIKNPSTSFPKNLSNSGFVRWLITDVLCDPSKLNTYFEARMIRDLNYGCITATIGNDYYTENSMVSIDSNKVEFNREIAYGHMAYLREKINKWEYLRGKNKI